MSLGEGKNGEEKKTMLEKEDHGPFCYHDPGFEFLVLDTMQYFGSGFLNGTGLKPASSPSSNYLLMCMCAVEVYHENYQLQSSVPSI